MAEKANALARDLMNLCDRYKIKAAIVLEGKKWSRIFCTNDHEFLDRANGIISMEACDIEDEGIDKAMGELESIINGDTQLQ